MHQVNQMIYFSFTTLSTVGFGDLHPKTNLERIVIAIIMVFGVSIFSYCLGEIVEMMREVYNLMTVSLHQDEELELFIGALRRFSGEEYENNRFKHFIKDMEDYFQYRWSKNSTELFKDTLFNKLPQATKNDLKFKFFYRDFILTFREMFMIKNVQKNRNYTMLDQNFMDFMQNLVSMLEVSD